MPVDAELIARCGDLKRELVAFSRRPRFASAFREACNRRGGDRVAGGKDDPRNVVDRFILEHKLPDGHTVVDHFVKARPTLTDAEKEMLLGWREVLEGIFEVQRHDGEALVTVNLIDELPYRIHSNMGAGSSAGLPPGAFVLTRLVPVADEWLFSGATNVLSASERDIVLRAAATIALRHPGLVFRNPDKLARGWELQRQARDCFIEHFGADLIVVPGPELAARMQDYWDACIRMVAGAAHLPGPQVPADLHMAASVGVVYDEVEGLSFCPNFGLVEAAFTDPERIASPVHRRAVLGYLQDDTISPLPLRRLASRDPDRASRLFQILLDWPGFRWGRDGKALLLTHKPRHFDAPALPSVVPLGRTLASSVRPS